MIINKKSHLTQTRYKKEHGFSLLELFFVTSIISIALAGLYALFNTAINDRADAQVASETLQLQKAAEEYVSLNFLDVLATIPTVGDIRELTLATMQEQNFFTPSYDGINSYGQQMRVYARNIDDNASSGNVIEVLTVSLNPTGVNNQRMPNERILNAANKGGPSLGTLTNITLSADCCAGQFVGSSKTWKVPIADFASATPPYNMTANDNGGYIAAYGRVVDPFPISNTDYLFRENMPTIPDANIMSANLDMNGNSLSNAGVIIADSIIIAPGENININSNATNIIQSPYALAIEGNLETDNFEIENTAPAVTANGNLFIAGDNTINVDLKATRLSLNSPDNDSTINVGRIIDDSNGIDIDNFVVGNQMKFTNLTIREDLIFNNTATPNVINFESGETEVINTLQTREMNDRIQNMQAKSIVLENLIVNNELILNTPAEFMNPVELPSATLNRVEAQGTLTLDSCTQPDANGGVVRCQ